VIALLAEAPDRQLDLVREMAAYISPRPGFTQHPLTVHAAAEMIDLVERALHFRGVMPSSAAVMHPQRAIEHAVVDGPLAVTLLLQKHFAHK